MGKFNKTGKREMPALNTSSLPDLIFTLLFFFMIVTTMREVTLKVEFKVPQATELEKLEKKRKEANGILHARRVEKCREYVRQHLQNNPCMDCGNHDWEVLEFDHIDPKCKNENISQIMRRGSLSVLEQEMEKCEVVCANCHKKRTNRQFGFWRLNFTE